MFGLGRSHSLGLAVVAIGAAIGISTLTIVQARVNPDNLIERCNVGTACIEGHSSGVRVFGVYGRASSSDGIRGVTLATSTDGAGVAGINTQTTGHSRGVYGFAGNGPGVVGVSTQNGSPGAVGANFKGKGGIGVLAEAAGPGDGVALDARAEAAGTDIFVGTNQSNAAACIMDSKANFACTGAIRSSSALRVQHRDGYGRRVLSYGAESATATIEDVGTSRITRGVANVRIDPAFAAVMDRKWYYVFLTPLGDTHGLYVSTKTPTAFEVREAQGGRSNLAFDYRIVARPLGAANDRLPQVVAGPEAAGRAGSARSTTVGEARLDSP